MGIEVAADAFGSDEDDGSHENVIVTGAADPRAAAAALCRAGNRFMRVTEDGRELGKSECEALENEASAAGTDVYTPN